MPPDTRPLLIRDESIRCATRGNGDSSRRGTGHSIAVFAARGKHKTWPGIHVGLCPECLGGRGSPTRNNALGDPSLKPARTWGWYAREGRSARSQRPAIPKACPERSRTGPEALRMPPDFTKCSRRPLVQRRPTPIPVASSRPGPYDIYPSVDLRPGEPNAAAQSSRRYAGPQWPCKGSISQKESGYADIRVQVRQVWARHGGASEEPYGPDARVRQVRWLRCQEAPVRVRRGKGRGFAGLRLVLQRSRVRRRLPRWDLPDVHVMIVERLRLRAAW